MKEVEMEKVLRCADVSGTSCQFVARGRTMDEILQQAGQHAVDGHGLTVTRRAGRSRQGARHRGVIRRIGGRRRPAARRF